MIRSIILLASTVLLSSLMSCQPLTDKNVDHRRLANDSSEDNDEVEFLDSPKTRKRGREILRSSNKRQALQSSSDRLVFEFAESTEYGHAVYYSDNLAGRTTANGEQYDPLALTAAHPNLPFNSVCRVTNLFNGRTVLVRINDRFPTDGEIVIDLSREAARVLGALQAGKIEVKVEADLPSTGTQVVREVDIWERDNSDVNVQFGKAAYYSDALEGRTTASGERYNRNRMTAAHPSLPFGTICRVTNLLNGRSVEVRINDRCSGRNGRIIDLSYRAASKLDAIIAGIVEVKVEVLESDEF